MSLDQLRTGVDQIWTNVDQLHGERGNKEELRKQKMDSRDTKRL
jgi:hypothetical protein